MTHHDEHDHDHDHDDHDHDEHKHDEGHEHHDDHDDHHGDPTDEHSDLHLELHRAVDELGKYAIELKLESKDGIPKEKMIKFIEDLMLTSTVNCLNSGADIIGHTKSFLTNGDGSIMSSLVDERRPVKVKDTMGADTIYEATLTLHVIVHGIWDDAIRELTLDVLPGVCMKWDMPYEVVADYYDTEKSIDHHL